MKSLPRTFLIVLTILGVGVLVEAKPLPEDGRILSGTLQNGVKWRYRQHNNPPGKMALMMHVASGSLNETDAQRGLAHFLEHMAFNGTENFPPGKLIPYFESLGMQFGADLNAYTSFDQTAYMLFTPDTTTHQIDKALMCLSDYAFRASLLPEEINKERGIVLEEARSGKNAGQRIRDKLWPDLFAGTRFATRLPIGDEKIISTASQKDFEDYYRAYYRPENITVVLVGDAPPDGIVPLITKWFGQYKASGDARSARGPEFKPFTKSRALVVTDPEMAYCQVQMLNIQPGRPPTVTVEQKRVELVEALANWMLSRRFDDRVKKGKANYRGAGSSVSDFFHDGLLIGGYSVGEAKDWDKMTAEMVEEIKRGREFGFSIRELELAKAEYFAEAEQAVRSESTQNARALINEIIGAVNNREPLLSAQQNLDLYKEVLPSVALSEINTSFKNHFVPGAFAFVITLSSKEQVPTQDEVMDVAQRAEAAKVEPLVDEAAGKSLLAKEPTPGKMTDVTEDKDLGIHHGWLSNGIRVHHRFMDYKKDSVMVSISMAGGDIEEDAQNRGVTEVASLAVNEAATHRLNSSVLRDLMTGKNISVSASPAGDHFAVHVTGSPKDLEIGLQKAHALLTEGVIEDSAFKNWRLSTLQNFVQRETMPQFKAYEAYEELFSGNDVRRMPLKKSQVEALSVAKGQAWFERLCRQPIEVAIVGEILWEDSTRLLEKYLGSLPSRARTDLHLNGLRKLARSPGPHFKQVDVATQTPQAVAYSGFLGSEGRQALDTQALGLAANILTSRLIKRVREELSIVYSIGANHNGSWVFADSGRFLAYAPCDPANASKVIMEVDTIFHDFAAKGPSEEELENGKKQILNHLDVQTREPSYWWSILRNYDLQARELNHERAQKDSYSKFTSAQVQEVFKKYYTPARTLKVTALPVKPKDPKDAAEPK